MMDRVLIFDTTLRDGEQSPGCTLNVEEKLEIAHALARLGVDIIEGGFPISSPGDFEAVRLMAEQIRDVQICGLARAVPADIDRAAEALRSAENGRIHVFISSSDIHLMHQMRKGRDEVLEQARAMVRRARNYTDNVEFSPMDATRSDPDYVVEILTAAVEEGATTLNIPDTVGYATPDEYFALIQKIMNEVKGIEKCIVSTHTHNDLGLAVANALAGIRAGARQVECTINGIGERAGNASLEEIVMALRTRRDFHKVDTKIDTTQIYRVSRLVADRTGMVVQANKAIVGLNAFRHESGIHQDGILKERSTYEIMDPASIGWPASQLVLGKHSGRHALKQRLQELGYELSEEDLNRTFVRFKELADQKKEVSDRDLEALVAEEHRIQSEAWKLDHVQVTCGDHSIATATVRLIDPHGRMITDADTGTGPVDAVYRAINRIIGVPNVLSEFSVKSVTEGIDAIGEVTIRIDHDGQSYIGRGASTDIIVASARAYMNALNRLLSNREVSTAKVVQTVTP
jgi:2-isopropylmalate synthase